MQRGADPASKQGAGQLVSRTIIAGDGGTATAAVAVYLDFTKPTVAVAGVTNGGRYYGAAPAVRCVGKDALSGIATCVVSRKTSGTRVTYTATATDKAGNVASTTGYYTQLDTTLGGAAYIDGSYQVRLGRSYSLLANAALTPAYAGAAAYPSRPASSGPRFQRVGEVLGTPTWAFSLPITTGFTKHPYWNVGVRVGNTIRIIRIHVVY